jgi:hypothetical protein
MPVLIVATAMERSRVAHGVRACLKTITGLPHFGRLPSQTAEKAGPPAPAADTTGAGTGVGPVDPGRVDFR